MGKKPVRYYFGRLNLIATFKDKKKFLLTGLTKSLILEKRKGSNWGFFDVSELQSERGSFLHGFLVKYKSAKEEEVADPATHRLGDEQAKNRVIAKARFFLHVETGIIAYHPVGYEISTKIFCERFPEILVEAHDRFFVSAEIQAIEERFKIFEVLKKFKRISKLSIYLHPSNPSNSDRWEKIDKRLKKLEVASYKEEWEEKPQSDGLKNVVDDEDLTAKIAMADDGYGKADISGEIDGQKKTISTSDNPITTQAPSDDQPADTILTHLGKTIGEIFERFTK